MAAAAGATLPVLMADADWKKRHAALITIAQVRGVWRVVCVEWACNQRNCDVVALFACPASN